MTGFQGVAMFRQPLLAAAALLLLAAAPDAALAQSKAKSEEAKEKARVEALRAKVRSYRCVAKDGRKHYGSTIPPQCNGELVEALSAQGTVLFRIDPPLTPEQKAAKAQEELKAAEAEAAKKEAARESQIQARRNQALLQTYAGEGDIERVRQRALADNRAAASQVQVTINRLKQRQQELDKEQVKYKNSAEMPAKLLMDVRAVAYDLSLQEQLLATRNKEAAEINARYDEEKRKYRELTGKAK
jgi:hypothetical protein